MFDTQKVNPWFPRMWEPRVVSKQGEKLGMTKPSKKQRSKLLLSSEEKVTTLSNYRHSPLVVGSPEKKQSSNTIKDFTKKTINYAQRAFIRLIKV